MKKIRMKVTLIVGLISILAAGMMQVFNGAYFLRDIRSILPGLPRFFMIVGAITLLACLYIAMRMRLFCNVVASISRGEEVPLEKRLRAGSDLTGIPRLLAIVNIVGFVLGPLITIWADSRLSGKPFNLTDTVLYEILNIAIGVMAALQEITFVDSMLVRGREALEIAEFPAGKRMSDLRTRPIIVAVAGTLLAGILVAMAGLGFYRTMVSWYSTLTTDALSSATTMGQEAISVNAWNYLAEMGVLIILAVGWGLGLSMTALYSIRAQVTVLGKRIRQIASGEADLTQRAYIVQFDEIGRLTEAINAMIGRLQGVALKVRGAAEGITASSDALTTTTLEAKKSVADMRTSLDKVKAASANQEKVVVGSNETLLRLSTSIAQISQQVNTQATYVEESSAAITQIAANITSVSKLTEQANGITRTLTSVATRGTDNIQEMEKSMAEITKASSAVNEIISVISRISSQTNLLAMNAAIEAAHAGDAGRGFAVVADEVRNLAESSAQSAKQIMAVIKQMQGKIKTGAQLSAQVQDAFKNISQGISSAASMIETIASSMSEQKAGANEVLTSVSSLIEATDGIKTATVEQTESSRQMDGATKRIVEAVGQIAGALSDQIRGVEALAKIVERVDLEAHQNTRNMSDLSQAVSGFVLK